MSALDYLRRWWELNIRYFGKLYRVADTISGIALLCVILFGFILFHRLLGISLPLSQRTLELSYFAFIGAIAIFGASVLIQTLAGLRAFAHKVKLRVLDLVRE